MLHTAILANEGTDPSVSKKAQPEELRSIENQSYQELTIKGKVTSAEDNSGLPGVNVVVKGTREGTITDLNGNFSIEVPSQEAVLEFSFIGFGTKYKLRIFKRANLIPVKIQCDYHVSASGYPWMDTKCTCNKLLNCSFSNRLYYDNF